jgi:lysozyme family protein
MFQNLGYHTKSWALGGAVQFRKAVSIILELEGGLVDDPRDPGGLTNYGISLAAYPKLGRQGILDLTPDEARAIYRRDFWDAARCSELPAELRLAVFDAAINQGVKTAIRILQKALGVTVDGVIGPLTLGAAARADPQKLVVDFMAERAGRYARLATFKTFGRGWMRRLFHVALESA